jgi:uncharacterized RDD family membrane protein YckC
MNEVPIESEQIKYAGFWRRLAAYLIDSMIISVVSWLLSFFGILGMVPAFIFLIAYVIGFWSWMGQTPGKAALGVKIVRMDGSKITGGTAAVRFLGYIISSIILYVGFIMIAFHGQKRGLHDLMADTIVIVVPSTFSGMQSTEEFESALAQSEEIQNKYHGF